MAVDEVFDELAKMSALEPVELKQIGAGATVELG